jgi:hypothetical protein
VEESSKATADGAARKDSRPGLTLFSFGYKGNAFGSFVDKRTIQSFARENGKTPRWNSN